MIPINTQNYFLYHLHSDYSSCVTSIDSATKPQQYIDRAKELGMTSLAFSEHGSVINWMAKKVAIEAAGLKYVHAMEAYLTEKIDLDENGDPIKVKDNYHCVLIAKNYEGVKEINKLMTKSFNRKDGHFYYVPRITFDELFNTSNNILITTACLAGVLRTEDEQILNNFITFLVNNKDRVYLEIQHHNVEDQKKYNNRIYQLHLKTGIPLIAGTDTHSLNEDLAKARVILQRSKHIFFEDEEGWDLTFKSYDELVEAYKQQNSLPMDVVLEAIENTNILADRVEPFVLDKAPKFPELYADAQAELRRVTYEAMNNHPYALKNHTRPELVERIEQELTDLHEANMDSFILFKKLINDWQHEHNIYTGPARGSVSGSMVAYLLGITQMDSMKFNLNFFRFCNKYRVSNPDIDEDLYDLDRDAVRKFLLTTDKVKSSEIVSFGTIALRGAIRDVGRALELPLEEVNEICDSLSEDEDGNEYPDEKLTNKYPDLFKYVKLLNGVITSIGTHPAGVLCATRPIDEELGLITIGSSDYYVSSVDMYQLDANMYTKMDELGLDTVGIINKACELAGIDHITPDNIPLDEWEVWQSIRDDTTGIFQWESPMACKLIKGLFSEETIAKIKTEIPDISMLKLFSFGNALIRPCGESIRDKMAKGDFQRTGIDDLDNMLKSELFACVIQEDIMKFCMEFCGYSLLEADMVRKGIAKKKGTAQLLGEIKRRFIEVSQPKYNLTDEKCEEIITPILNYISDAARYAFSWNHSDAYSFIGYAAGWLRYHYPLAFVAACLNVWADKPEKTANIIDYTARNHICIRRPMFRFSRSGYYLDNSTKSIYKGLTSIKYLSAGIADDLYLLRNRSYPRFIDLLYDLEETSLNARQLDILIKLDYFSEFGNAKLLKKLDGYFDMFGRGTSKTYRKDKVQQDGLLYNIIARHSEATPATFKNMNVKEILYDIEDYLRNLNISDFSLKEKFQDQLEYLGYISSDGDTSNMKLRQTLVVLDVKAVKSKKNGRTWVYTATTQSLGSGKQTVFSVTPTVHSKKPLNKFDTIFIKKWHKNTFKGVDYWYIDDYDYVV